MKIGLHNKIWTYTYNVVNESFLNIPRKNSTKGNSHSELSGEELFAAKLFHMKLVDSFTVEKMV